VNKSFNEFADDDVGGVLGVIAVGLNRCIFVRGRRKKVFLQFSSKRCLV
jgi:hypothetical protein